ncbi:hypothetical protein AaE_011759, partial [Aphanomyces astaci]
DLGIPIYDLMYVHFKDVPRALVQRVLAEGSREKHAEITRIMEEKGINKQFDEMWFRTHGKKHQRALVQKERSPLREYSSALIIQRFLGKARLERTRRLSKSVAYDGSTKLAHPSSSQQSHRSRGEDEGDDGGCTDDQGAQEQPPPS